MGKKSNEFQKLVVAIHSALAGTGSTVTESAMLKDGSTEIEREVDVLIESVVAGHVVRIAVEVRDHSRSQDVQWIDGLIGKYRDLPIDRVVAVSSTRFTPGAAAKAKAANIKVLHLSDVESFDWTPSTVVDGRCCVRLFARPLVFAGRFQGRAVAVIRFDWETGRMTEDSDRSLAFTAQSVLEEWPEVAKGVFYPRLYQLAVDTLAVHGAYEKKKRYVEIVFDQHIPRQMHFRAKSEWVDQILWGIGIDCAATPVPELAKRFEDKLVLGYRTVLGGDDRRLTVVLGSDGSVNGEFVVRL